MAKPFKIVLIVAAVLIGLLIAAAIALPLLFDPNNFRDQISSTVKDKTGRDFEVGNIELHVFPWLRVGVEDVRLGNAEGFGDEPFAAIKQLDVGVALMPLLTRREIKVSGLTLDGLRLNAARNAQGTGNWEDLIQAEAGTPEDKDSQVEVEAGTDLNIADIGGLTIHDAVIRYRDDQAKTAYRIEPLNLETSTLKPGEAFDVSLDVTTFSDAPKAQVTLELTSRVTPDLDNQIFTLDQLSARVKSKLEDSKIDADVKLAAQIVADLNNQQFSLNDLEAALTAAGEGIPGGSQTATLNGQVRFDQGKGTLTLDHGRIEAAGVVATTQISGTGLNGDKPRLSGPIHVEPFSPRKTLKQLGIELETADDTALANASLDADYSGSFSSANLDKLNITLDQTHVDGRIAISDFATQALQFALKVDQIDADRYLPPKTEGETTTKEPAKGDDDINAIELPTEALEKLNADGTVDIGKLKINGISMTDIRLQVSGSGSNARVQNLSAKLYGGSVNLNNRFVPGQQAPSYALKTQLNALNAAPFLKDLLGEDYVSGLGNVSLDLNSRGTTVGDLRRALNGEVAFKVENGAVKGFNLGQILRKGEALLEGRAAPAENEPRETDFATLSGSARIVDGILKSDDLNAASPAFRLTGSGQIDLVKETINYVAKPTVVETKEGQGGKGLDKLKGLTIPIKLSGSLFSPSYKLDIEKALKEKAKGKIEDKLRDELNLEQDGDTREQLKDKLNEKLGDFLFGKPKKNPTPTPAPSPTAAPQDAPAGT